MEYETLSDTLQPRTLLLKGPSGSGKTTLAAQLPDVVIFNFDNNLAALQKMPLELQKKIRILNPKKGIDVKNSGQLVWQKFLVQLEGVMDDDSVVTVIIDSLTTLTECLMDFILGSSHPDLTPSGTNWGAYSRYLKHLGDCVLCVDDLDKNIVIIAHEQTIMDSLEKEVKYALNVSGKMKNAFEAYFTDCWRLSTKGIPGQNPEYVVGTSPTHMYSAKCSIPGLGPEFKFSEKKAVICQTFRDNTPKKIT